MASSPSVPPTPPQTPPPSILIETGAFACSQNSERNALMSTIRGADSRLKLRKVPLREKKHFNFIDLIKAEELKRTNPFSSKKLQQTTEAENNNDVRHSRKRILLDHATEYVPLVKTTNGITSKQQIKYTTDEEIDALLNQIDVELAQDPEVNAQDLLDILDGKNETETKHTNVPILNLERKVRDEYYRPMSRSYELMEDELPTPLVLRNDDEMKEMEDLIAQAEKELNQKTKDESLDSKNLPISIVLNEIKSSLIIPTSSKHKDEIILAINEIKTPEDDYVMKSLTKDRAKPPLNRRPPTKQKHQISEQKNLNNDMKSNDNNMSKHVISLHENVSINIGSKKQKKERPKGGVSIFAGVDDIFNGKNPLNFLRSEKIDHKTFKTKVQKYDQNESAEEECIFPSELNLEIIENRTQPDNTCDTYFENTKPEHRRLPCLKEQIQNAVAPIWSSRSFKDNVENELLNKNFNLPKLFKSKQHEQENNQHINNTENLPILKYISATESYSPNKNATGRNEILTQFQFPSNDNICRFNAAKNQSTKTDAALNNLSIQANIKVNENNDNEKDTNDLIPLNSNLFCKNETTDLVSSKLKVKTASIFNDESTINIENLGVINLSVTLPHFEIETMNKPNSFLPAEETLQQLKIKNKTIENINNDVQCIFQDKEKLFSKDKPNINQNEIKECKQHTEKNQNIVIKNKISNNLNIDKSLLTYSDINKLMLNKSTNLDETLSKKMSNYVRLKDQIKINVAVNNEVLNDQENNKHKTNQFKPILETKHHLVLDIGVLVIETTNDIIENLQIFSVQKSTFIKHEINSKIFCPQTNVQIILEKSKKLIIDYKPIELNNAIEINVQQNLEQYASVIFESIPIIKYVNHTTDQFQDSQFIFTDNTCENIFPNKEKMLRYNTVVIATAVDDLDPHVKDQIVSAKCFPTKIKNSDICMPKFENELIRKNKQNENLEKNEYDHDISLLEASDVYDIEMQTINKFESKRNNKTYLKLSPVKSNTENMMLIKESEEEQNNISKNSKNIGEFEKGCVSTTSFVVDKSEKNVNMTKHQTKFIKKVEPPITFNILYTKSNSDNMSIDKTLNKKDKNNETERENKNSSISKKNNDKIKILVKDYSQVETKEKQITKEEIKKDDMLNVSNEFDVNIINNDNSLPYANKYKQYNLDKSYLDKNIRKINNKTENNESFQEYNFNSCAEGTNDKLQTKFAKFEQHKKETGSDNFLFNQVAFDIKKSNDQLWVKKNKKQNLCDQRTADIAQTIKRVKEISDRTKQITEYAKQNLSNKTYDTNKFISTYKSKCQKQKANKILSQNNGYKNFEAWKATTLMDDAQYQMPSTANKMEKEVTAAAVLFCKTTSNLQASSISNQNLVQHKNDHENLSVKYSVPSANRSQQSIEDPMLNSAASSRQRIRQLLNRQENEAWQRRQWLHNEADQSINKDSSSNFNNSMYPSNKKILWLFH